MLPLADLCRLPPGQEIEPRQLSPHPTDRIGAKCLLLTQRVDAIEKIISRERPDALLPTMGGQTALNVTMELAERGVLEKYRARDSERWTRKTI